MIEEQEGVIFRIFKGTSNRSSVCLSVCVCMCMRITEKQFYLLSSRVKESIEDHKEGIQSYPFAGCLGLLLLAPSPQSSSASLLPESISLLASFSVSSSFFVCVCLCLSVLLSHCSLPGGKTIFFLLEVSPVSLHTNVAQLPCSFSLTLFLLLLLPVDKLHLFDFTSLVMLGV